MSYYNQKFLQLLFNSCMRIYEDLKEIEGMEKTGLFDLDSRILCLFESKNTENIKNFNFKYRLN